MKYTLPPSHPKLPIAKRRGVLLVNLGTPDGTGYWAVRRYLSEFLSDPRVIELPRMLWWLILQVFVLPLRPFKSGQAYAKIWNKAHNASPLRVITIKQTEELQARLGNKVLVRYAMRYGQPNIPTVLDEMVKAGCDDLNVVPLYPQYAGATTGTVGDEVARWMTKQRWQPAMKITAPYYDKKVYVEAVAESIRTHIAKLDWTPEVVVASFHGLPLKYCEKGDPYYCHCHKSARLIAEELGSVFATDVESVVEKIPAPKVVKKKPMPPLLLTFQSRFGKAEWLQPYTDKTLHALAVNGIQNVLVVCPGFSADCVETLEEIALGGEEIFFHAGGRKFGVVACLNDSDLGMGVIEELIL